MDNFNYRYAKEGDEALVLNFIKALADYEKMSSDVVATEDSTSATL